jgi:hypothetical protein
MAMDDGGRTGGVRGVFFLEASVCAVFVDAYGAQQQGGERLLLPIST